QCTRRVRDQPGSEAADRRATLPPGPVLPHQRSGGQRAGAARAARRPDGAGARNAAQVCRTRQAAPRLQRGSDRGHGGLRMAGQRARAREQGEDRADHGRRANGDCRGPRLKRGSGRRTALQSQRGSHACRAPSDSAGARNYRPQCFAHGRAARREPPDAVRPDGQIRNPRAAMIAVTKEHRRSLLRAVAGTAALLLVASCGLWMDSEDMLKRARQEQEKGDLRAALVDLRTLLRKDPQMLEARVALGEVSLQMGDVASAIRELELARNSSLPLERVVAPLARAYLAGQRPADALALLDSAPTVNSDASLSALRGTALLALNRGAEAKQAFETAVRIDPKSVDALLGLASALAIDDLAAGLAMTDRALALAPDTPRVHLARGALQMQGNRFTDAEKEFRTAAELAKKQSSSTYLLAALAGVTEALLARDDAAGALEVTAQLQKLAPNSPVIRYLRARALFQAGKPAEARPLLEENLSGNAQVINSKLLLGAVKLALGDLGQAEMYLASVVAADPDNSAARRLLAEARLRQSKPKDALDAIAPMLDKPDASKELLALAGRASLAAGATASGLEYLQRGAKIQPADVGAQLDLVAGYVAAGKFDEARTVLESLPGDNELSARRTFLQVLTQLGARNPQAALETARNAAAAAPKDANTQALAGAVFAQAGQFAAAK